MKQCLNVNLCENGINVFFILNWHKYSSNFHSPPAAATLCDILIVRCSQAPDLNLGGPKNQEKISQFSAHTHQQFLCKKIIQIRPLFMELEHIL